MSDTMQHLYSLCCPVSVSFSYQFRRKIVGNPGFWYITGMDFLHMEGFKIKEHKHLYFTIPPEMFQKEYWGQKYLEEIELLISDKIPEKSTPGKLIFVEER